MLRKLLLVLALAAAGFGSAVAVARSNVVTGDKVVVAAHFNLRAKVTRVLDGDTIRVRYARKNDIVRLIGIDAPEVGGCYALDATTAVRNLAGARNVRLLGDMSQSKRDRYGRLLAYVRLPNGRDLGLELVREGAASVYVYNNKPFAKLRSYSTAEAQAKQASQGIWGLCAGGVGVTTSTIAVTQSTSTEMTTTVSTSTTLSTSTTSTTTTTANCAPSYPDVCIPPPPPDLDCGQIPYRDFRVRYDVPNPDPHRFDGDHDGVGCES
jgi:micrococcal nuclease